MDAIENRTSTTITTTLLWVDKYNQKNFIIILLISSAPFLVVTVLILILFGILSRIFTIYKKRRRNNPKFSIESVLKRKLKIETNYTKPSLNINRMSQTPSSSSDKSVVNQAYLENEEENSTIKKQSMNDINETTNSKILNKLFVNHDLSPSLIIEPKIIRINPNSTNEDENKRICKIPTIVIQEASDDEI